MNYKEFIPNVPFNKIPLINAPFSKIPSSKTPFN
jgi:hypothetical protein